MVNIPFVLSLGDGQKTIYAKFCTQWGVCSDLISNSIIFLTAPAVPAVPPAIPAPTSTTIGKIIGGVKGVVGGILSAIFPIKNISAPLAKLYSEVQLWIPGWFKAPPVEKIPVEQFVSRKTPFAFGGKWTYIDPQILQRFVFAPLPKEFLALESKFPQVRGILQKVGVNRLTDIQKLKNAQIYLPGLTQAVAFNAPSILPGKISGGKPVPVGSQMPTSPFGPEVAIPVGQLPPDLKNKIPPNVIFARAAGQLVDFKIALSLTAQNRPEQTISTISGKSLQLTVGPDFPAKSVTGYLVFRSKTPQARVEVPLASLLNSLFFAEPAFAYTQEQPVPVEEKLVLLTFNYTDPDGDGIYTANIQSPVPAGEYEIITVINYVDPELGSKQIRLITVVDPEGYVFEKVGDKELRIPNASVTLYRLNTANNSYEVWPAKEFQQENPQVTDVRGSYSFWCRVEPTTPLLRPQDTSRTRAIRLRSLKATAFI